MAHLSSCLAGIDREAVRTFTSVLERAGFSPVVIVARLDVAEVGKLKPSLLVCDVDNIEVDSLEMLRQLRFVLTACIIVVSTSRMERLWSIACHLAGANGLLLNDSTKAEITLGVRAAIRVGCFTDPRFAAA